MLRGDPALPERGDDAVGLGAQDGCLLGRAVLLQPAEYLLYGPDDRCPGELDDNIAVDGQVFFWKKGQLQNLFSACSQRGILSNDENKAS